MIVAKLSYMIKTRLRYTVGLKLLYRLSYTVGLKLQ